MLNARCWARDLPRFQARFGDQIETVELTTHRFEQGQATAEELLEAAIAFEDALDAFGGPIPADCRAEFDDEASLLAVVAWAAELAEGRGSGLVRDGRLRHSVALQCVAGVERDLDAALARLNQAYLQAETLVSLYWPAIQRIAAALLLEHELDGDRFRWLLHEAMPAADALSA